MGNASLGPAATAATGATDSAAAGAACPIALTTKPALQTAQTGNVGLRALPHPLQTTVSGPVLQNTRSLAICSARSAPILKFLRATCCAYVPISPRTARETALSGPRAWADRYRQCTVDRG